jgi:hypothetical protein
MEHLSGLIAALPEQKLFNFPPTNHPDPIAPLHEPISVMHPFNIPDGLFTAALDARVPLTIATVYAVTVKLVTKYNLANGKKPWAISKTRPFFVFVVLHNIALAVYSAWTFWGMLGGMRRSIISPAGPGGVAATVDSFCRLHGEPGLGNSVYFNDSSRSWDSLAQEPAVVNGLPDLSQGGRMWTEGLAYFGWIFYLSKYYEVLDTFIILAKGKPSSTLQTYHHAGAMLCMWAGMRYMASPIWIFVLVNSLIHALMYTYYTLTAFSIRVPLFIKRTLTTLQITQFLLGASHALSHSFVTYVIPVTVARSTIHKASAALAADVPAEAAASLFPGALESLKQLIFGAGAEVAAPAQHSQSATVGTAVPATETLHTVQPCIMTAGETFALWINVVYLAPLTYLFISFFIASYVKRSNAAQKIKGKSDPSRPLGRDVTELAEKAGWDAARDVEREVYGGERMVNGNGSADARN